MVVDTAEWGGGLALKGSNLELVSKLGGSTGWVLGRLETTTLMALLNKSNLSLTDDFFKGLRGVGPLLFLPDPGGLANGLDLFDRIGQERLMCPSLLQRKHEFKPPRVSKIQVKESFYNLMSRNLGMSTLGLMEIKTPTSKLGTRFTEWSPLTTFPIESSNCKMEFQKMRGGDS